MRNIVGIWLVSIVAGLLALACADGGSDDAGPAASDAPSRGSVLELTPRPRDEESYPPFEGPQRAPAVYERTNFREIPEYQLPAPGNVPESPIDAEGLEFQPPADPTCPEEWVQLVRPVEKFAVCFPPDWQVQGHGEVIAGIEDRWYSLGLFKFEGDRPLAHVSIYRMNPYAQPFTYTRNCEQAYRVSYSGKPAVLCPGLPGSFTEAKIIAYHVRVGEFDYFVNAVIHYEFDEEKGKYVADWPKELEEEAIRVAHTFRLLESPE